MVITISKRLHLCLILMCCASFDISETNKECEIDDPWTKQNKISRHMDEIKTKDIQLDIWSLMSLKSSTEIPLWASRGWTTLISSGSLSSLLSEQNPETKNKNKEHDYRNWTIIWIESLKLYKCVDVQKLEAIFFFGFSFLLPWSPQQADSFDKKRFPFLFFFF